MALPIRSLTPAPPDPILGLTETFRADTRPNKVNLAVGVYVDDSGVTPVIPSVLEAERRLLEKAGSKGYLPIDGRPGYKKAVRDLIFGADHEIVESGRSATAQTPGGTGALRVAADFLLQTGSSKTIWLSEPTWPNHPQLFALAGFSGASSLPCLMISSAIASETRATSWGFSWRELSILTTPAAIAPARVRRWVLSIPQDYSAFFCFSSAGVHICNSMRAAAALRWNAVEEVEKAMEARA